MINIVGNAGRFGAALLFVTGTGLFLVAWWSGAKPSDLKDAVEALAVVAAASYFAQRLAFGYFVTNLSVGLTTERAVGADGMDWLSVAVNLKKGDRGTVRLNDVQVRFQWKDCYRSHVIDVARLAQRPEPVQTSRGISERATVDWKPSEQQPFLNMTPGEELTVSCFEQVPRAEPCQIEVVVLGKGPSRPHVAQWRASTVSLPTLA